MSTPYRELSSEIVHAPTPVPGSPEWVLERAKASQKPLGWYERWQARRLFRRITKILCSWKNYETSAATVKIESYTRRVRFAALKQFAELGWVVVAVPNGTFIPAMLHQHADWDLTWCWFCDTSIYALEDWWFYTMECAKRKQAAEQGVSALARSGWLTALNANTLQ